MKTAWFIRFKQVLLNILLALVLTLILEQIGRIYLLVTFATPDVYSIYADDLMRMFFVGTLYDIRIACTAYLFLLVIGLCLSMNLRLFCYFKRVHLLFSSFTILIVAAITIINIYYYKTYQNAIDVFIFSIIDDDTRAIIKTMISEYPLGKAFIVMALLAYLTYRFLRYWNGKCARFKYKDRSLITALVALLLIVSCFVIGARGSLGTFPLRRNNSQVSSIQLLNKITPNGLMSLIWAYDDYQREYFAPASDEAGERILSQFFGKPMPADLSVFMSKTGDVPQQVAKRPPHVVLTVMESWGMYLLKYDKQDRDILGKFRQHWRDDFVFKRFISEGNGTIDSFMRLLVRSPMSFISRSSVQHLDFMSNMLKPYIDNGYKIVFVTAGSGAWQNLNNFLPNLGVSEFVEANTLRRMYPEAKPGAWGLPDEYMFNYVENRLLQAEKDNEHLLVICLSTTFHPPFDMNMTDVGFSFNEAEQAELAYLVQGTPNGFTSIFSTLRYTLDQQGEFMDWVKSQPLAGHTVVAMTGDHNIRGLGLHKLEDSVFRYAVPFYLYLPKAYRAHVKYEPFIAGSHKDIWPTLYNISLPHTQYYKTGCDLLAAKKDDKWCFGYNDSLLFNDSGAYYYSHGTDTTLSMPWRNDNSLYVSDGEPMNAEQTAEFTRFSAMEAMMLWQMNRQVQEGSLKK